jgi:hypothetical protein
MVKVFVFKVDDTRRLLAGDRRNRGEPKSGTEEDP